MYNPSALCCFPVGVTSAGQRIPTDMMFTVASTYAMSLWRLCGFLVLLAFLPLTASQANGQPGQGSSAESDVRATECDSEQFKVAVDVGHTKEAPGAISARGVTEFTFNVSLGRQIEQRLLAAGFSHTILITTSGQDRSQLLRRADRANTAQVDLFMSIHHDDVQPRYYSQWRYNTQSPYRRGINMQFRVWNLQSFLGAN
jgi:N-acetylmuramoyl-L-alanine amidase